MINEEAVKGQAEFARKLNAGELDHTPAFTTGQVNKNGEVVPLPRGEEKTIWNSDGTDGPALICAPPPTQGKTLKLSGNTVTIPLDPETSEAVACVKCGILATSDELNWQVEGYENDPICGKCEQELGGSR